MGELPLIAALLSFYDETPDWLERTVLSLARLPASHLVCCDGAYELFENAQAASPPDQHEAIRRAADAIGLPLTLHVPDRTWRTEMEKRGLLFRLGETVTAPDDWYLVVDADEQVVAAPPNLPDILAEVTEDVAEVLYHEPQSNGRTVTFPRRALFRAQRGIHLGHNHYTYLTQDGRELWGGNFPVPAFRVPGLECDHRSFQRPKRRQLAAHRYYRARDAQLVEVGRCRFCGRPGTVEFPHDFADHPAGLIAKAWASVCATHEPKARAENRKVFLAHGLDPDLVRVTFARGAV